MKEAVVIPSVPIGSRWRARWPRAAIGEVIRTYIDKSPHGKYECAVLRLPLSMRYISVERLLARYDMLAEEYTPSKEISTLRAERDALAEQLRWRKWDDEKPVLQGVYLVRLHALEGVFLKEWVFDSPIDHWSGRINPTHWRPIGPLPAVEP